MGQSWTESRRMPAQPWRTATSAGSDAAQLFDKRVEERVRTLADNARIAAFDRLGENLRALEILEARVRNGGRGEHAKSARSEPTP